MTRLERTLSQTKLPARYARLALEMRLDDLELRLLVDPDANDAAFERACILAALGRNDDATQAYHAILARSPEHFGALNNLGMLLYESGAHRAALQAYELLVERHPDSAIAHTHVAKLLHDQGRAEDAVAHYERAIALDPSAASAHHGLATILSERGDEAAATRERRLGFTHRPVTFRRYRGEGEALRVLLVGVDGEGNVPMQSFLDDKLFATASLIVDFYDIAASLPPHDIVFNAIGDADRCALALTSANAMLAETTAPILNPPATVLATGRVGNAERLGTLTDVVAPRFAIFPRWLLQQTDPAGALTASGFDWPVLLRAPGFHTGEHFIKVDDPAQAGAAIATLPGTAVMAIAFLDTRDSSGMFRKYRVITVDGKIYPLHLAISKDWKVHYFSADMVDVPEHRALDAAFLEDPQATVGARGFAALERIVEALALDYGGIDFSVDDNGRVVLFEANATMIVQPPPADAIWDYRRKPVERIIKAFQGMLRTRALSRG